ncbi:hypothetical protein [Rhizobium sp. BK251]|uniref:hypothetical protein n=1 Tax=Rhizobium sp. BK251 TaxID=2512125 RepID=UPI00104E57E8|nr:hypothetical protein [Rhizobium sp. BK251]TCL63628.1 hypothetical protein EV286_11623 [Rhizobium sp. BK251]
MTDIPDIHVKSINGFGESGSGANFCLDLTDSNGKRFIMHISRHLESQFLGTFQGAAQFAAKKRNETAKPETLMAMNVKDVTFGVTDDNTIGIVMSLVGGARLNLSLPPHAEKSLADALEQIRDFREAGGPETAQ